jgi:hypothetical protein
MENSTNGGWSSMLNANLETDQIRKHRLSNAAKQQLQAERCTILV